MSFFVNLTSNQSDHIFPNNHPSDFYAELYEPLELEEEWQVALADISYCGQRFPNIKRNEGIVTLKLPGKQTFGEIVVTYMQCDDIYIKVDVNKEIGGSTDYNNLEKIGIRRSHYSWNEIKIELVKATERFNMQSSNRNEIVTMEINDESLKLKVNSINHSIYKFTFSYGLKNLLNIHYYSSS